LSGWSLEWYVGPVEREPVHSLRCWEVLQRWWSVEGRVHRVSWGQVEQHAW
jgi:hypothetical protein